MLFLDPETGALVERRRVTGTESFDALHGGFSLSGQGGRAGDCLSCWRRGVRYGWPVCFGSFVEKLRQCLLLLLEGGEKELLLSRQVANGDLEGRGCDEE